MKVTRENNEIIISIPDNLVEIDEIQNFLDYLRFREITSRSKAKPEDVENLASEIDESWWRDNMEDFRIKLSRIY